MSTLLILIAAITGNYPDKRLDSDRAERYNTQQYLFVKLPSGNRVNLFVQTLLTGVFTTTRD